MKACRIYLVGPRASGKTTVGKELAALLGWRFADTDDQVVRGAGCPVSEIVRRRGWDAFRDMETAALRAVHGERNLVVATGGGMVLREENRRLMRDADGPSSVVVWLRVSHGTLVDRLCAQPLRDQRPPLVASSQDGAGGPDGLGGPGGNADARPLHVAGESSQPDPAVVEEVSRVLNERLPLYASVAHVSVDGELSVAEIAADIVKFLETEGHA